MGKTRLIFRFTKGVFLDEWEKTVADGLSVSLVVKGITVDAFVWETDLGSAEYDSLYGLDFFGKDVLMLCFDVSSRRSFVDAEEFFMPKIKQETPGVPILLVGTKSDLRRRIDLETELVTKEEARALAERTGCVEYIECSALTGENVERVFESALWTASFGKPTATPSTKLEPERSCCFV